MIKLFIHILHSKRDNAGNVYWAFIATDPQTGKSCFATISGGESNILAAARYLVGEDGKYNYTVSQLAIRAFKRDVKDYPYAGCHSEYQIARFIKLGLGWEVKHEEYKVVASRPPKLNEGRDGFVHYVVGPAGAYRVFYSQQFPFGQVIKVTDQCFEETGASWSRKVTGKLFKLFSISDNTNSFGLHGHLILALDGECWEFARSRDPHLDNWNRGAILELDPKDIGGSLARLSCEIPNRRTGNAPQAAVNEIWN